MICIDDDWHEGQAFWYSSGISAPKLLQWLTVARPQMRKPDYQDEAIFFEPMISSIVSALLSFINAQYPYHPEPLELQTLNAANSGTNYQPAFGDFLGMHFIAHKMGLTAQLKGNLLHSHYMHYLRANRLSLFEFEVLLEKFEPRRAVRRVPAPANERVRGQAPAFVPYESRSCETRSDLPI